MNYKDKRLAVLGCGKSGIAASRLAIEKGANVNLFDTGFSDDLVSRADALSEEGIKVYIGDEGICQDPATYELVVISPGISLDWEIVKPFREAGITVISEIEFAYAFCESEIVGVTGTLILLLYYAIAGLFVYILYILNSKTCHVLIEKSSQLDPHLDFTKWTALDDGFSLRKIFI